MVGTKQSSFMHGFTDYVRFSVIPAMLHFSVNMPLTECSLGTLEQKKT